MKKEIISIIVLILVVILLILNFLGVLYPLNNLFPQNPDNSCRIDSDCKLHVHPDWSQCRLCGNCKMYDIADNDVIAINKNWKPFCPFGKPTGYRCPACIGGISGSDVSSVKCIDNVCQKVLE